MVCCEYCGKVYSNNGNLQKHLDSIHFGNPKVCYICEKSFYDQRNLKRHISTVHSSKTYQCPYCIHTSSRIDHLKSHIKVKHEQPDMDKSDFNIVCELCGDRFTRYPSLKQHTKSKHEGVTYSCPYCIKQFVSKSGFTKHVKMDHNQWEYEKRLLEGKKHLDFMVKMQVPVAVIPEEDMHKINLYRRYVYQKIDTFKDINVPL